MEPTSLEIWNRVPRRYRRISTAESVPPSQCRPDNADERTPATR